jgi:hypothetical protein
MKIHPSSFPFVRTVLLVWGLALSFLGGGFARGENLDGHAADPSASVDLSDRFLKKVDRQTGENCSVYATAALVEAACFAKTGRRMDLSEASLIADHYRFYLRQPFQPEPYPITDAWIRSNRDRLEFSARSDIQNHHHASVLASSGHALSGFDGAYPRQILTQILLGNVLAEWELPTDEAFFSKIRAWSKAWGVQEDAGNHDEVRLGPSGRSIE